MNHDKSTCKIKGCGICDTVVQDMLQHKYITMNHETLKTSLDNGTPLSPDESKYLIDVLERDTAHKEEKLFMLTEFEKVTKLREEEHKEEMQRLLTTQREDIVGEVTEKYGDGSVNNPALVVVESNEGSVTQRPALNDILNIINKKKVFTSSANNQEKRGPATSQNIHYPYYD